MESRFFVDREDELDQIKRFVAQPTRAPRVISIYGPGGIGKTALLQETCSLFTAISNIRMGSTIDFAEVSIQTLDPIMPSIARDLGRESFANYLEALAEVERMRISHLFEPQTIEAKSKKAMDTFFQDYAEFTRVWRPLLFFDTIEAIQKLQVLPTIFRDRGTRLDNTILFLAGRENDKLEVDLRKWYGKDNVLPLEIKPFTPQQTGEFWHRADAENALDQETREKLELLSGGKPIILQLAADWIKHSIPMPNLIRKTNRELNEGGKSIQRQFEQELVSGIRLLREPRDRAILYMALFHRRCNAKILSLALDLSESVTQEILDELCTFFFVKPLPKLHDVIAELITKWVWPSYDREQSIRQTAIRRIIDEYYEKEIREKNELIAQHRGPAAERLPHQMNPLLQDAIWQEAAMRIEKVNYELDLDLYKGYFGEPQKSGGFQELWDREYSAHKRDSLRFLMDTVSDQHTREIAKSPQIKNDLAHKRLRSLRVIEDQPRIWSEGKRLLSPDLSMRERIEIQLARARVAPTFQDGLRVYDECIRNAQSLRDKKLLGLIYNSIGLWYRRFGLFDQALEFYRRALARTKDDRQLAALWTNQGYIYRQKGDTDKALRLCQQGLNLRLKLGQIGYEVAENQLAVAEIFADQRMTAEAMQYFEEAAETLRLFGSRRTLADVYVHIANIHRQEHRPELVMEYLDKAFGLLKTRSNPRALAGAYNERACELRKRGWERWRKQNDARGAIALFKEALSDFQKTDQIASKIGDHYRLADNLVDQALLYRYWYEARPGNQQLKEKGLQLTKRAMQIARRYNFVLFIGRSLEILGDFAYAEQDFQSAFVKCYAPACEILAGYPSERFRETEKRVIDRAWQFEVAPNTFRNICQQMIRTFESSSKVKLLQSSISTWQDLLCLRG